MSTARTIAKNATALMAAQAASYLLGFFYFISMARSLGGAGFGILSFAIALASLFTPLTDLGIATLMIREVARDKSAAPKYLAQVSLMKMLLAGVTFGATALIVILGGYPWQTIMVVCLLSLSVIISAFTTMIYSVFTAFEKMEYAGVGILANAAFIFAGVMLGVKYHFGPMGFASLYVYASAAVLIYSLAALRWRFSSAMPRVPSITTIDFRFWKDNIKQGWPFAFTAIFGTIAYYTDSVMLSFMKGNEAVGWYNAAFRSVATLSVIPLVYFAAIFPVMARMHLSSTSLLRFMVRKSFQYMLIIAVPIGVGTTLLAGRIISVIFGAGYSESAPMLRILIWSMAFIFATSTFSQLLNSVDKQMTFAKVVAVCALLNVLLNALLIPRYGGTGASIDTVVTQFAALILSGIFCARIGYGIPGPSILALLAKIAAASAAMSVLVLYFDNLILWALIPLAALLYFAVLFLVRGIGTKEDIMLLRAIVGRK